VPITRRDRSPPTMACGGMCARRATCVCRSQRVAIATSRARRRAARATRPPARPPRWRRDVRQERHLCVPHPARRDRSELCTTSCCSRVANLRAPATAAGGALGVPHSCAASGEPSMSPCHSRNATLRPPAGRATCVCRIRRDAIAASRARSRVAIPRPACHGRRRDMRRAANGRGRGAASHRAPPSLPPTGGRDFHILQEVHCPCLQARLDPVHGLYMSVLTLRIYIIHI